MADPKPSRPKPSRPTAVVLREQVLGQVGISDIEREHALELYVELKLDEIRPTIYTPVTFTVSETDPAGVFVLVPFNSKGNGQFFRTDDSAYRLDGPTRAYVVAMLEEAVEQVRGITGGGPSNVGVVGG